MRVRATICGAFAVVLAAAGGHGDVFPIVDGNHWNYEIEYSRPGTEHYTAYFDGVAEINGHLTHVQRRSGGLYHGVSYWSIDAEGDVYSHGGANPPLLYLDVPLFLGKMWSTTTQTPYGPITVRSEVIAIGPVTVPAGTFECFSVARFANPSWPYAVESFADGVGLVEMTTPDPFRVERLLSLPGPVFLVPSTWSSVRQLYR